MKVHVRRLRLVMMICHKASAPWQEKNDYCAPRKRLKNRVLAQDVLAALEAADRGFLIDLASTDPKPRQKKKRRQSTDSAVHAKAVVR